ncbi:Chromatin-remodeling complexes subunit NGG1 [Leucoagaricus sp. SymC.cos]|nr:Chromatin-remodeling complexes subunit NGG1 [Leucoagaricus sp. SymC.cos]
MPSKLNPYQIPDSSSSAFLKNTPDAVPSVDDLERIHSELKMLRQRAVERARKAGEDLRTIEESMRRMKEKEKGKLKAVDKIKRERDFTPLPDGDDARLSGSHSSKSRNNSIVSSGNTPVPRGSNDPRSRSVLEDAKKKKKKRKREDDSDADQDARPRKTTPPSNHTPTFIPPPPKSSKPSAPTPQPHSKPLVGPDFSVPAFQSLLQPRPPTPPPPIPGPSKPSEVTEDFSKAKQPSQTLVTTFYSSIEPWIRPIREEDVGFLEYTGDEIEPFIMPKLGRHYLEVWEDQDTGLLPPVVLNHPEAPASQFIPPEPKWDPSTLADIDLVAEEKGHGPLTERVPDFTEKMDDPIATALRHAQTELRQVVAMNKARKTRLISVAQDRLGYQEYLELRDSIDKNITALFSKLQKKDISKPSKKKKKIDGSESGNGNGGANGVGNGNGGMMSNLAPSPAAIGFNQNEDQNLLVNDQLKHLVETRRQWVDTVGTVFEQKERENSGRIWGLPKESIYQGIEEEAQRLLVDPGPLYVVKDEDIMRNGIAHGGVVPGKAKVKGKERAGTHSLGGDEMDLT